jgi:hypothetical protein
VVVNFYGDIFARDEAEARRAMGWAGFGLVQTLRARGAA